MAVYLGGVAGGKHWCILYFGMCSTDGDNIMDNDESLETTISTPWVGSERDYTYEEVREALIRTSHGTG